MAWRQPLIGGRETEICPLRGHNIDRSGLVWWYRIDPNDLSRGGQPSNLHKTAHVEGADGASPVSCCPSPPRPRRS